MFGIGRFSMMCLLTDNTGAIIPGTETDALPALAPANRVLNEPDPHMAEFQAAPCALLQRRSWRNRDY